MQSWIFTPLLQFFSVTWSLRNHSHMLIWCLRNIYYYFQCRNFFIFVAETLHFCRILWWIESSKEQFIWNRFLCGNSVNLTVIFDKPNASLLNKNISSYWPPNFWTVVYIVAIRLLQMRTQVSLSSLMLRGSKALPSTALWDISSTAQLQKAKLEQNLSNKTWSIKLARQMWGFIIP